MSFPTISQDGQRVFIEIDGAITGLSAQDACDLHQQIASVLPELVQPFKPWPREENQ